MPESKSNAILQAVNEYSGRLFRFIRGRTKTNEDAEDILQDVWYQVSNFSSIDTIEEISGWLYAIAKNKIIDRYRKKGQGTAPISTESDDDELPYGIKEILFADSPDPATSELKKLFWEGLFSALEELPENQRRAFEWNELDGLTLQEIADRSGENIKTVISRKRYAVAHLRKRLQFLYNEFLNN